MKRLLTTIAAAILAFSPLVGSAQNSNGTAVRASLAAANATATVSTPAGTSACGVGVTGTWSGTITFQVSDGLQWSAVNVYPANSTSAQTSTTTNGSFNANVGGFGGFRAIMTSYSSGTAVVQIACSTAVAHTQGGGGGGGGGGVSSVTAGNQVAVTGTDTEPVVGVVTTPSFTSVSATTVSATNVNSTNVTASSLTAGNCVQAGTGGILTSAAAACGSGGGGGPTTNIAAAIEAFSGITHYYKLNEAAGSTTVADSVGSANGTVNNGVTFGVADNTRAASTAAWFADSSTHQTITLPAGVVPTSGAWYVGFLYEACSGAATQGIFQSDSTAASGSLEIGTGSNGQLTYGFPATGPGTVQSKNMSIGKTFVVLYMTGDGFSHNYYWVDGIEGNDDFNGNGWATSGDTATIAYGANYCEKLSNFFIGTGSVTQAEVNSVLAQI